MAHGSEVGMGFNIERTNKPFVVKSPYKPSGDQPKAIEELELTGSASDKLAQLFALSPVIDAFFDNTMVMAEDEAVKNNRLALLAGLVSKANAVAAFNQLNTK